MDLWMQLNVRSDITLITFWWSPHVIHRERYKDKLVWQLTVSCWGVRPSMQELASHAATVRSVAVRHRPAFSSSYTGTQLILPHS